MSHGPYILNLELSKRENIQHGPKNIHKKYISIRGMLKCIRASPLNSLVVLEETTEEGRLFHIGTVLLRGLTIGKISSVPDSYYRFASHLNQIDLHSFHTRSKVTRLRMCICQVAVGFYRI